MLTLKNAFSGLFSRSTISARSVAPARSRRLRLEWLEERTLLAAGDLDPTFGTGGWVSTDFQGPSDRNADFSSGPPVIQADGKILVPGYSGVVSSGHTTEPNDFALARYNSDGTLDLSFDLDGRVTTDFFGLEDEACCVAVQADGRILIAGRITLGSAGYAFGLVRYNPDGSLDGSFDGDGKVTTDFGPGLEEFPTGMILQDDGKIVVAGVAQAGSNPDFALARYNPDGSLDTSFDDDGKVTTDIMMGSTDFAALNVVIVDQGRIVVGGRSLSPTVGSNLDFVLVRYNSYGNLDASCGIGGKVTTDFADSNDRASFLALQADGKLVLGGTSGHDLAIARYNSDCTLDESFYGDGLLTTDLGGSDSGAGIAFQTDGKIVAVARSVGSDSEAVLVLVRYDSNGSLDNMFGNNGKVVSNFSTASPHPQNEFESGVSIDAVGKLIVTGTVLNPDTGYDFLVARYLGDNEVTNADPAPTFTVAPLVGVAGQPLSFAGDYTDPDGDTWSLTVDCGPGGAASSQTINQTLKTFAFTCTYSTTGTRTVAATVTDDADPIGSGTVESQVAIDLANLQTGVCCSGAGTALVVGSLTVNDRIHVNPIANDGSLQVTITDRTNDVVVYQSTFVRPAGGFSRIVVFGQAADDHIQIAGSIEVPACVHAGGGNDNVKGGSGHDILIGGEGDDLLVGGNGRDLLIGGIGSDRIVGNPDDDILIAGTTDHDHNEQALCDIMKEWTRADAGYATRVGHLRGDAGAGTGLNGSILLVSEGTAATVHDDRAADVLTGSAGSDWFLLNLDGDGGVVDKITDLSAQEFANDLDFIGTP